MGNNRQAADWQGIFKKWYTGFACAGLAITVIFRVLGGFGMGWVENMEKAILVYFNVAFLLAFILLGIFIFGPRKQKGKKEQEKQSRILEANEETEGDIRIDKIPLVNIHIDSEDIRYMDSTQIIHFFEGVKQSLVQYGKTIKESRENATHKKI
jgi:hypothetical protein